MVPGIGFNFLVLFIYGLHSRAVEFYEIVTKHLRIFSVHHEKLLWLLKRTKNEVSFIFHK